MKTKTLLFRIDRFLIAIALFAASATAEAQTSSNLATWGVNGLASSPVPTSVSTTNTVATGITASTITRGTGIGAAGAANSYSGTNWNQTSYANAIANNDFFTFTLSAAANYSYSISNITFVLLRSGTGATNAGIGTSLDSFATALATNTIASSGAGTTFNVNPTTLTNLTTSLEFRIAGWNMGGATGTLRLYATNTSLNPSVSGTTTLRSASVLTWDGGRGNGSWTAYDATNANQANWNGNNTPLNGDSLLFAGTTQTNTTNDVSSLLANSIVFSNTAGTFVISGNALTVSNGVTNLSTSGQTFSNAVTLGAAQTFNASAGNLTFAGNIANGGNLFTVDGASNTAISGAISGSGGLTKSGNGSLTLGGSSGYTGATTLNGGTTRVSGSISSSAVAVNNTAILEGAGTTGGLTINSGGRVAPGNAAVGTLSVSSLTLESGGGYNWEIGNVTGTAGTNWDLISSTGATTVNSTSGSQFTIYMIGTWAGSGFLNSGTYNWTIIDGASSSGFSADKFALDLTGFTGGTATGTFSFTESSGDILLNYTAPVASSVYTWNAGSGAWSVGGNWTNGTAPTSTGASLQFTGGAGTATNDSGTVTSVMGVLFTNTTGSITLAGSEFAFGAEGIKNASTDAHTISNSLSLSAASTIEATSGSLTIAGNVTNDVAAQLLTLGGANNITVSGVISGQGNVAKSGAGTATLDGNNTFTGSLSANAGSTIVNGTLDTLTINVGGGTLVLGASDRLANSAAVSMSGGTLDFGGFTDTVSSYAQTGGTFSGNGTLTASTYALNGGTVSGNLGAGTATASSGSTTLNGTLAALTVNVSGGSLTLGATDRLDNAAVVSISSGTFSTGAFNDTVGSFSITGGTHAGSGTLTASTYALNGGTVSGNLGAGTATASSGSTTLSGTLAAATVNVSGGSLTLGANDRLDNAAALSISSGTFSTGAFNDTVGSFSITGGTYAGAGTLTASTYALDGGTVSGNLDAGTATASSGSTTLNGTLAALTVNVSGGSLTLGATDRLDNAAALSISSGTFSTGAFNDTVGSFSISGGTFAGAGTLTAATYALTGGTVSGNLGAGAATASSGSTSLTGTLAGDLSINSGATVTLGSSSRIGNTSAVTLSGTLDMATFFDTVGSFTLTGGTLGGSGTLTAATYSLQGGTLNANLGSGNATVSSGTTAINGNVGGALTASGGTANVTGTVSGNVTVSGGTMNLSAGNLIGDSSSVSVSSGSLNLAGNDTVGAVNLSGGTISGSGALTGSSYGVQSGTISAAIAGSGALTKSSAGTVTLSADNSAYSGAVNIGDGRLVAGATGALGSGVVTMTNGSLVAAAGATVANSIVIGTADGAFGAASALQSWDFFGATNATTSASTFTNSSLASGVSLNLLTRGATAGTNASAANSFRTQGFQNNGISTGNTDYFEWKVASGTTNMALRTLDARFNGTASFYTNNSFAGATNQFAWSTNGTSFNLIGSPFIMTNIGAMPTIDLSGIAELQNLGTNTTVTFRFYASGQTTTGGWGFNSPNAGAIGLELDGAFAQLKAGSGILGIDEAGSATFSGAITNNNVATLTAASGGTATFSGGISGLGSVTKTGTGDVVLAGANTYSGGTTINEGVLYVGNGGTSGSITGPITNNSSLVFNRSDSSSYSGAISGSGSMSKSGAGSLTLSGASSYSGATTITAGTLQLNNTTGQALASTIAVSVANEAVLLLSQSNQVNDSASVSLSGGTITRGSGVSEVFGSLNLTQASFLDFGTGATGTLSFTSYTPSALLTVNNFLPGNKLTFTSNLSSDIENGALFSFGGEFQWDWDTTTPNTFTITAIPEPSTYLAAAGLLGLMLWPSRKRIIKDAKKILGLTAPMRDRLARKAS